MLSELRARPAPLLLLASVLSETLAAKGDHISFVIGPFRPRVGPPPSDPEPRGRSLHRGAPESVEPAMAQRGELGSRVVNAAGPLPRHLLSETSRRARLGWPRQRCCAYRALLAPCALASWGFEQLPNSGCLRARARVPPLSLLCRLFLLLLSVRWILGLIGIRNPFNLQRSKLTSARVLGGGWGRGHRGGGSRQTGNISPLGTARFCVLPPSSLQPPPFSGPQGR